MHEKLKNSLFPVFEWTQPKFAILGGFSLDMTKYSYHKQYLNYLEILSKVIPVKYFANQQCKNYIESKIEVNNITFIDYQLDSLWIRDYAPIWLQDKESDDFSIVNFPYGANHFEENQADDGFSSFLSKELGIPLLFNLPKNQIPFYFDGGNILVDEFGNCYTSIREDDPPKKYRKELLSHINCHKLVIMNSIPQEPTGHVDMFMKIFPNKKALLAKYKTFPFKETMEKNKQILLNFGFDIIDLPHIDLTGYTSWSYANAVVVGKNVFIPQYGHKEDQNALNIYSSLGYKVYAIEADMIMKEKGSLHCITNFIY